jgi:diguanylate cyclase (GGDEF)-like protein
MLGEDEGEHAPGGRARLGPLLIVVAAWVFATLLLSADSVAVSVWPLFSVPIVLAGLLLGPPGAIVLGALSALAAFLLLRHPSPAVWMGLGSFSVVAAFAGAKIKRDEIRISRLAVLSAVDQETGVCAGPHFRSRIEEESRRSVRYRHPFGVLRVSVAGYEGFVEKFGTFKGKALLGRLAEAVRVAVRDSDVVGRIGDHDIGVLLPHSGIEECQAVAARIEDVVAQTHFEGDAVEPSVGVQACAVWAVFPGEADSVEALLALLGERISAAGAAASAEAGACT